MPTEIEMPTEIQTTNLRLVPQSVEDIRVQMESLSAEDRAQYSPDWIARVFSGEADWWTLGFVIALRSDIGRIGACGFKGPPDADGAVEIAYGLVPEYQNRGLATEAASALVGHAFRDAQVRVVRAHTLSDSNASARVLTKCGFRLKGQVVDPEDGLVWRWEIDRTGSDESEKLKPASSPPRRNSAR